MSTAFLGIVALYYALTLAYSLSIKNRVVADIILLSGLYTLRIIAGGVAVQIVPSFWLLAFSMFLFLSLAMVKRYSEIAGLRDTHQTTTMGRGYHLGDLPTSVESRRRRVDTPRSWFSPSTSTAISSSGCMRSRCTSGRFRRWCCTGSAASGSVQARGKIDDDPLVFALRDGVSRWIFVAAALIIWLAT